MASYRIEWKQSASKELRRLAKPAIPKVLEAVAALAENPQMLPEAEEHKGSELHIGQAVGWAYLGNL